MSTYKLDRTVFKAQTAEEAANHAGYYAKLSWQERLAITSYLNSVAFNYGQDQPPRLNKMIFKARARNI